MDPLDKLEMVLEGMIKRRQNEIERSMGACAHPAYPYINGLEHEKVGLEIALLELRAIRHQAQTECDGSF
jgi:hypothetical protein